MVRNDDVIPNEGEGSLDDCVIIQNSCDAASIVRSLAPKGLGDDRICGAAVPCNKAARSLELARPVNFERLTIF